MSMGALFLEMRLMLLLAFKYELPARQKESLKAVTPNGRQGVINSHRCKNISNLGKPLQHVAPTILGKATPPERHKPPSVCHLGVIKPHLLLLLRAIPALLQLERAGHTEGGRKAPQGHQGDTGGTAKARGRWGCAAILPRWRSYLRKSKTPPKLREINLLVFLCLFS